MADSLLGEHGIAVFRCYGIGDPRFSVAIRHSAICLFPNTVRPQYCNTGSEASHGLNWAVIDVIGAPFDLCGKRLGSRLGPAAVRLAGLVEALEALKFRVTDCGDVEPPEVGAECGLRNFQPLIKCIHLLRERVLESLRGGRIPVVIGGEHSLAMGGVSAALQHFEGDLGLLWIDAHADINTPGSSSTGNLHGMPVAALAGLPSDAVGKTDDEWRGLLQALGPTYRLDLEATVWYGLRDVDGAERGRLAGCPITMHDIDRHGVEAMVSRIDDWLRRCGVRQLWISFDVDALDPILAPGTGTGVRGGLTYREAHLTAELIREALDTRSCPYQLAGVDLVETNPLFDTQNQTAKMSVEWIASLFGKTILGTR